MFEGLMGYYVNSMYPEWYNEDIKNISRENKLLDGWFKIYGPQVQIKDIDTNIYGLSQFFILQ